MSHTITPTVFYRRLDGRGWKSSIAKPVLGLLPPFCSCTTFRRLLYIPQSDSHACG